MFFVEPRNVKNNCICGYLLQIKKKRYHQNYYIIHLLLLTSVIKFSFFVILKMCNKRIRVQIQQKTYLFLFFHLFMISTIILIISNLIIICNIFISIIICNY